MKIFIILALVAAVYALPDDFYDPRYDNFDVDEVIDNMRLLKSYCYCFLGKGRCTPDGTNFKKWLPEAVQTSCGKCTGKQKVLVAKVAKALRTKLPAEWQRLLKEYDPKDVRREALNEFLSKYAP